MAIGNGKILLFDSKVKGLLCLYVKVIVPFLSIFLRDVYFIKVRSQDLITTEDGQEELNLKVNFNEEE